MISAIGLILEIRSFGTPFKVIVPAMEMRFVTIWKYESQ